MSSADIVVEENRQSSAPARLSARVVIQLQVIHLRCQCDASSMAMAAHGLADHLLCPPTARMSTAELIPGSLGQINVKPKTVVLHIGSDEALEQNDVVFSSFPRMTVR